ETEPEKELKSLDADNEPLQPDAGTAPLDKHLFVLAPQCAFGAMRPQWCQPEKRVELKPAECAGMGAKSQVAFRQPLLRSKWDDNRCNRCRDNDSCCVGVKPNDSAGSGEQFENRSQQLPAKIRKQTNTVNAVAALNHIRDQPTMKIAIPEPRDLA